MNSTLSEDEYWEKRTTETYGDWGDDSTFLESYKNSINHPHRELIIDYLRTADASSLLEVGCCNGPNLYLINRGFPTMKLAGQDVNKPSIDDLNKWIPNVTTQICKLPTINTASKEFDYVLADACLMYVQDVDKALQEMKRVAKKGIIIIDWCTENEEKINYSQTRNWLLRLEDHEFKNIKLRSLTEKEWPSANWIKYGRFITAQVP